MAVRDDWAPGEVLTSTDLNDTFASKLDLAGGKILQIVRATDATNRSTTSTSAVDGNVSVTITPQKNTSNIILIATFLGEQAISGDYFNSVITNSSNTAISGAQSGSFRAAIAFAINPVTIVGYDSPATTSATTYKIRFYSGSGGTVRLVNATMTAQLFAIEVSA